MTGVPIQFNVVLKPPFYIRRDDELKNSISLSLEKDEEIVLLFEFVPVYSREKECSVIQDYLKLFYFNHPKTVSLKCQ